jgi:hypothetical protein
VTLPLLALTEPTEPVRCCGLRASGRRCGLALIREPWRSLGMGEDCAERAGLVQPRRPRFPAVRVEAADTEPTLFDLINEGETVTTAIEYVIPHGQWAVIPHTGLAVYQANGTSFVATVTDDDVVLDTGGAVRIRHAEVTGPWCRDRVLAERREPPADRTEAAV